MSASGAHSKGPLAPLWYNEVVTEIYETNSSTDVGSVVLRENSGTSFQPGSRARRGTLHREEALKSYPTTIARIRYLTIGDFRREIFPAIARKSYDDRVPLTYELERENLGRFEGVLRAIQHPSHYPRFGKKLSFLFLRAATGHLFSNGNKRLAVFAATTFAKLNGYEPSRTTLDQYRSWLGAHFPEYECGPAIAHGSSYEWAMYNFTKAVVIRQSGGQAGHSYDFEALKLLTQEFFSLALVKSTEV